MGPNGKQTLMAVDLISNIKAYEILKSYGLDIHNLIGKQLGNLVESSQDKALAITSTESFKQLGFGQGAIDVEATINKAVLLNDGPDKIAVIDNNTDHENHDPVNIVE